VALRSQVHVLVGAIIAAGNDAALMDDSKVKIAFPNQFLLIRGLQPCYFRRPLLWDPQCPPWASLCAD
jgi:hypothetical protein